MLPTPRWQKEEIRDPCTLEATSLEGDPTDHVTNGIEPTSDSVESQNWNETSFESFATRGKTVEFADQRDFEVAAIQEPAAIPRERKGLRSPVVANIQLAQIVPGGNDSAEEGL